MYCVRQKFIARIQVRFVYRCFGLYVWNKESGYAFRCTDEESVRSVLRESPAALERL
jgi:hypothetical protein